VQQTSAKRIMHVMQDQQHQLAATSVSNQMSELIIGSPHWESGGLQSLVHGAYLDEIQQWVLVLPS